MARVIGATLLAARVASLAGRGSEADISEPAGAAADGVEFGGGPAETMPATAPGTDEPGPAAEVNAEPATAQP